MSPAVFVVVESDEGGGEDGKVEVEVGVEVEVETKEEENFLRLPKAAVAAELPYCFMTAASSGSTFFGARRCLDRRSNSLGLRTDLRLRGIGVRDGVRRRVVVLRMGALPLIGDRAGIGDVRLAMVVLL